MVINFIGSPSSGKTTIAANLFAYLKGLSIVTEFLTEEARRYISKAKSDSRSLDVVLKDYDQYKILVEQYLVIESFIWSSHKDTIIVCDSSPVNALFYMDQSYIDTGPYCHSIKNTLKATLKDTDIFFYCKPVYASISNDLNRIHTLDQSLVIDKSIPDILKKYYPELIHKMYLLDGTLDNRFNKVKEQVSHLILK